MDIGTLLNTIIKKKRFHGYDRFPFIFLIAPSTKNLNCFEAINIHHLPLNVRIEFLIRFNKFTNFINDDIRKIFTHDEFLNLFGTGLALQNAIRFYNKKNILNPYRVFNKAVPLYVEYNGDILMKNHGTIMNKYFLNVSNI